MDSIISDSTPVPSLTLSLLSKTLTKLLRFRRDNSVSITTDTAAAASTNKIPLNNKEIEVISAKIFTSLSTIKASYAQLQLAQTPYDPNSIQSADHTIITELNKLSTLKHIFFNRSQLLQTSKKISTQIQEQLNLLKTCKITTTKLESKLQSKQSELNYLQSELRAAEKSCRSRSLAALNELHLSGLNPTHFLTFLRYTIKSIRSFTKTMIHKMESSGWDLDAAARAIQPELFPLLNSKNRFFAFESYVSRIMFSNFKNPNFGLGGQIGDRRQFFAEFSELKFEKDAIFDKKSQFGKFCASKYLSLVHEKMEKSFFYEKEDAIDFGLTDFVKCFGEMARRVWLLHCLFFSFEMEDKNLIFEVKKGSRFSEVFMENVEEDFNGDFRPEVGFTVEPGFRVLKSVIQCRVYLIDRNR